MGEMSDEIPKVGEVWQENTSSKKIIINSVDMDELGIVCIVGISHILKSGKVVSSPLDVYTLSYFLQKYHRYKNTQRSENKKAGIKHDQSKPRFSLLPQAPLWQVVAVLEFGANKYGADNWRHVPNAKERYFNAAHRHLNAWWAGEKVDSESGLSHLAHAVCCLMFLMVGNDEKN